MLYSFGDTHQLVPIVGRAGTVGSLLETSFNTGIGAGKGRSLQREQRGSTEGKGTQSQRNREPQQRRLLGMYTE